MPVTPEILEKAIEATKNTKKPKYQKGDMVFYLAHKGIVLTKILGLSPWNADPLTNDEPFNWEYHIDYKEMGFMDGAYAPCGLNITQDKLFSTKQELKDSL